MSTERPGATSTRSTLLVRVRDPDDDRAWREFDDRYRELILRYGRSRGLQEADAEDVRQAVMIALARSLRGFTYDRARGRFRDYLYRVTSNAVNRAVSHPALGAERLSPDELGERVDDAGPREAADEAWEREWMHHHLRTALRRARVSFEARTLEVFESLLAGRSAKDVAAATGLSVDAVYKVKFRVRDHLEELVAEQLRDEEP